MSGGPGAGRRGSYHGGTSTPSGARRPSRGGRDSSGSGSDNVLPLLTGVLGSSLLAFSLYVFSQKGGFSGIDQPSELDQQPEQAYCEQIYYGEEQAESYYPQEATPKTDNENKKLETEEPPKIKLEKKKWLTAKEEETLREKPVSEGSRTKLQRELKQHLRKVKELTEELERDEKTRRFWPRDP